MHVYWLSREKHLESKREIILMENIFVGKGSVSEEIIEESGGGCAKYYY